MNEILTIVNVMTCGLISIRIIFYKRCGMKYKPVVSLMAYILVIISASVPIRVLFNDYSVTDVSEVLINLILCITVFSVKGNVSILFFGHNT